jgi:hypothetical protein
MFDTTMKSNRRGLFASYPYLSGFCPHQCTKKIFKLPSERQIPDKLGQRLILPRPAPSLRSSNDLLNDDTNSQEFYGANINLAQNEHHYYKTTIIASLLP